MDWFVGLMVWIFPDRQVIEILFLIQVTQQKASPNACNLESKDCDLLCMINLGLLIKLEKIWILVFCYNTLIVSPGTYLMKNHESQSRINGFQFKKKQQQRWVLTAYSYIKRCHNPHKTRLSLINSKALISVIHYSQCTEIKLHYFWRKVENSNTVTQGGGGGGRF